MFKDVLKEQQPIVYQILLNSLKSNQLAHAYLFSGQRGSKMKEAAILLAQTLVCPNREGFACEKCDVCRRIKEGTYVDLIVINGKDRTIKKEEILDLQHQFIQTGLEMYSKKIYIIEHADRATPEALNSLLKFLEEPSGEDTTAILISENTDRLLPTIISRCQVLTFASLSAKLCESEAIANGVTPMHAYIASQFIKDVDVVLTLVESEAYQIAYDLFMGFIDEAKPHLYQGLVYLQKEGTLTKASKEKEKDSDGPKNKKKTPEKDPKELFSLFLDIAQVFFKDASQGKTVGDTWWNHHITSARYQSIAPAAMRVFSEGKDKIWRNVNLSLLLDQMIIELAKR